MLKIKFLEILSYLAVAVIAVGLAFSISLKVLKPALSQEEVVEEASPPSEEVPSVESAPDATQSLTGEAEVESVAPTARPQLPAFPMAPSSTANAARSVEVFLEPFIYDEKDRRDPFVAFREESGSIVLTAIQKFPLESINLIGIMWDIRNPKAMFVDPTSQVHVLGPDESIGNRNGYIAAIREGEVVVVETERKGNALDYLTKVIKISR